MISIINNKPFTNSFYYKLTDLAINNKYEADDDLNQYSNYYNRSFIDLDNNQDLMFEVARLYNDNFNIGLGETITITGWINKVTPSSNQDDPFHTDESDFTFLVYLNSNFTGGEFEWKDNQDNIHSYLPSRFDVLYISNQVRHRVRSVIEGTRYSAVFFGHLNMNHKGLF